MEHAAEMSREELLQELQRTQQLVRRAHPRAHPSALRRTPLNAAPRRPQLDTERKRSYGLQDELKKAKEQSLAVVGRAGGVPTHLA
jgi:hypothetical protein